MPKQVAGKPEGATLLDAINDGEVEFPGRMTFMDWLKWRKSTGTRPLKKRDGVSTTLEEENVLWKEVMDFLHDAGEEELEEEEEEEEEEEQDVDAAVEPAPPPAHPAAGAHTGLTDKEFAGLDATSVELLPDAEREAALAAAAAKSAAAPKPSSGPGPALAGPSDPPSTPAMAETLQAELRELYRPDQESVSDYLTRLARVVLALRAYGVNVGQPELEKLTTKATLLAEEFGKIGGDWHPTRMVRALRARFSAAALRTGSEEPMDAEESQKEIQTIGELILALGGRESSSPGSQERRGGGDSPLRLAAMEMELEALKKGSDGGGSQVGGAATGELAEALKAQTLRPVLRAVVARAPSPRSRLTWHGPP